MGVGRRWRCVRVGTEGGKGRGRAEKREKFVVGVVVVGFNPCSAPCKTPSRHTGGGRVRGGIGVEVSTGAQGKFLPARAPSLAITQANQHTKPPRPGQKVGYAVAGW